ncbi:MAG: quinol dehydrogenase ferredoxin subunit NapH [Alphaproteobacteria bacterium]|nr:quinol dehydrogenase ferredoxin subunit NapH [Alphaproteobacteria bacterium]
MKQRLPGQAARARHGWWKASQWLVLRRLAQVFFLGLFLTGPLIGVWITKGTLASSLTLSILPLTDPLFALQSLLAHHSLEGKVLLGAGLVLAAYALIGGRMFCSWVCPVNLVTDGAAWLRSRLNLPEGVTFSRSSRLWILGAVLAVSALTGTVAWEFVNPVTILHRGLVFGALYGAGLVWILVAALFLFDLAVSSRGWCGHLCPVGAFYGLIGRKSLLRVSAIGRQACDDCLDCYKACPEPQVISPALKGAARGLGPLILSGDCTNCGRCIDVCPERVFEFSPRWMERKSKDVSSQTTRDGTTKAAA